LVVSNSPSSVLPKRSFKQTRKRIYKPSRDSNVSSTIG
jgi:hypothetical protein